MTEMAAMMPHQVQASKGLSTFYKEEVTTFTTRASFHQQIRLFEDQQLGSWDCLALNF